MVVFNFPRDSFSESQDASEQRYPLSVIAWPSQEITSYLARLVRSLGSSVAVD